MYRTRLSIIIPSFIFMLAGCYSSASLTKSPNFSSVAQSKERDGGRYPAVGYVYVNGVDIGKEEYSSHISETLNNSLLEANMFSFKSTVDSTIPKTRLDLKVNEDRTSGIGTIPKEILGLLTIGMSSIILPLFDDYKNEYVMSINWASNTKKTYTKSCEAGAVYTFGKRRDAAKKARDLMDGACIKAMVSDISVDYEKLSPDLANTYSLHDSSVWADSEESVMAYGKHESAPLNPRNSVVRIDSGSAVGSGFFLDRNLVVTNAHVVGNTKNVALYYSGTASFTGRVFYVNNALDFAMIKTGIDGIPLLTRDMPIKIGEEVYTLGYPQGRRIVAYSSGTILGSFECCLVHNALIAGGSSGGPLLDEKHRVLGLNTLISKMPKDMVNASDRAISIKIDFIEKKIREEGLAQKN